MWTVLGHVAVLVQVALLASAKLHLLPNVALTFPVGWW